MYTTPLDSLVTSIANDIFNHKHFRPLVNWNGSPIRHLLLPDIQTYIFNFIFDSTSIELDQDYIIDLIAQSYYGTLYAYPILTYVNGYQGLQDLLKGTQLIVPNSLSEFANKYHTKYDKMEPEEPVEIPKQLQENQEFYTRETPNEYLSQVFGKLFVEAISGG